MFVLLKMIVRLIVKEETVLEMEFLVYVNARKLSAPTKSVTRLVEIQHPSHQFLQLGVN